MSEESIASHPKTIESKIDEEEFDILISYTEEVMELRHRYKGWELDPTKIKGLELARSIGRLSVATETLKKFSEVKQSRLLSDVADSGKRYHQCAWKQLIESTIIS